MDELLDEAGRATRWLPDEPWFPALHKGHPAFAEGMARVGDVITGDCALPGGYKLLFAAVIAAVKRDRHLVGHYLGLAAEAGVAHREAEGAGVGVLISRGVVPHRLLTESIGEVYGPRESAPVRPATPPTADVRSSLDYFSRYFGFVPDYVELLGERAPVALEGYFLMREAALTGTALPAKIMELLLCAVNAAEYQSRFVMIHARGARKAGATEEQLVEACLTALPFAGVASWLPAADGIFQSRPDS
ncbi:carboxymuconolactone decarboxylase family protein [Amycolatopsis thermoflava]|uniref:carboxymuconolactone decarboxylase family protein n=1 Tax=Amycolatopsis thermoflava TaxID=84480 RepID=UPI0038273FDC